MTEQTAPSPITIPRPAIHTGPAHKTVDEATADYLLEAAGRVVDQCIWGSGVSALVARTLTDAAMAIRASTDRSSQEAGRDAALYGLCPVCHAPRTVVVNPGGVTMSLACRVDRTHGVHPPEVATEKDMIGYAVSAVFHDPLAPGTPVLAWPMTRNGSPLVTRTRGEVWSLGDGTRVVSVKGYAGGIALTHVDVLPGVTPPASEGGSDV